jgi:competence protein ComEA
MKEGRAASYRVAAILLLVTIIIAAGVVCWVRFPRDNGIEITLRTDAPPSAEIYVGGDVGNPGFYPLKTDDTVEALVRAAGGSGDNRTGLSIYLGGKSSQPQKVNINTAEVWLLEALPGVGETRAKAIIDYRSRNGPFRNTADLLKTEGFGDSTYGRIKDLITVAD